jgi:hypothetical protein
MASEVATWGDVAGQNGDTNLETPVADRGVSVAMLILPFGLGENVRRGCFAVI